MDVIVWSDEELKTLQGDIEYQGYEEKVAKYVVECVKVFQTRKGPKV